MHNVHGPTFTVNPGKAVGYVDIICKYHSKLSVTNIKVSSQVELQ